MVPTVAKVLDALMYMAEEERPRPPKPDMVRTS